MKIHNKIRTAAAVVIISLPFVIAAAANASATGPGSEHDPLVSKSYVDGAISTALGQGSGGTSDTFTPVSLAAGQIIIGEEGTQIILRSGAGVAYHIGADGLVDVTDGTELSNGGAVERNHLLIIPRSDGRGVRASADSWFIVKGGYRIDG